MKFVKSRALAAGTLRLINLITFLLVCFSLEYQQEIITFNAQPIYAILSKYMLCDIDELTRKVNQLVDFEEAKISESVERYTNL